MSEKAGEVQYEKKEVVEDNARKFVLETISPEFLAESKAIGYVLITDWIATAEDTEEKLVYKKLDSGEVQYFSIAKITRDGSRTTDKKKISEEEYKSRLPSSILRLEKKRYDFSLIQDGISFACKYDEFPQGKLRMLEVDAANEPERKQFNPDVFPFKLQEVSGDMRYYGYRVAGVVNS